MPEESGTDELDQCHLDYLESIHSNPAVLKQRYPHTYDAFAAFNCEQVKVLHTIGEALAKDNPKGDHHGDTEAVEDAAADASAKLEKYLYAVH
jgi:hypothetical protein